MSWWYNLIYHDEYVFLHIVRLLVFSCFDFHHKLCGFLCMQGRMMKTMLAILEESMLLLKALPEARKRNKGRF